MDHFADFEDVPESEQPPVFLSHVVDDVAFPTAVAYAEALSKLPVGAISAFFVLGETVPMKTTALCRTASLSGPAFRDASARRGIEIVFLDCCPEFANIRSTNAIRAKMVPRRAGPGESTTAAFAEMLDRVGSDVEEEPTEDCSGGVGESLPPCHPRIDQRFVALSARDLGPDPVVARGRRR